MFGNIGDLLKKLDFKNLDIPGIASKLIPLVPDGKGKQAMDLAMSTAKRGGSSKDVKRALENMLSPQDRQRLASNQIWSNIPDDKDAIVNYGTNVAKQFQFLKQN